MATCVAPEIGTDMTRFPAPGHLVSWAKFAPKARRDGGDDPGAVGEGPGAAGGRDPQLRHNQAGGAGTGGLAARLAGARRGDGKYRGYWKGPFYRLEAEGIECVLADAKQVKHLPGRPKHDRGDSRWLAACFERGAITPCFVATEEFRVIRLHTRYRRDLIAERTREKQRAEKLLESAAIKLSSVVTGLHGVTGQDIMGHLMAGERNPKGLGPAGPHRRPAEDSPTGRSPRRRGVLHRRPRRAAPGHAGAHRPARC
jgi:Transposase